MTKQFAMIVGWVLIIVGVLNFFVVSMMLMPVHAVFHIVAGVLGVWLKDNHEGYTMWVGIVGVGLAIMGFAGMTNLLGVIDLTSMFNWVHLILGVLGLLVYFNRGKGGMAMPQGMGV